MLNHIVLMGRLTRDPELRHTGSGLAVASFSLAVDRDYKGQSGEKETDFVDIVADGGSKQRPLQVAAPGLEGQGRKQPALRRGGGGACVFRRQQAVRIGHAACVRGLPGDPGG